MKIIRERGISMVETTGALAIGSLMLIGLTSMINDALEDSKGQQAASHHAQVVAAARQYISAHYSDLVTKSASGKTATISIDELAGDKRLPTGFSVTNAYRQRTCVLVRQRPVAKPGDPVQLDALVATYDGDKIKGIGAVAANAGPGSGYIRSDSPATARGASWQLADTAPYQGQPCNDGSVAVLTGGAYDADHLVSQIFFDGKVTADFLYRDDTGDPLALANQMNMPIGMAGNAVKDEGTDCGDGTARIAVDKSNDLLKCDKSTKKWTPVTKWKNPVASYGDLDKLTEKQNGDVRMVMEADWQRAFVYNGTKWVALAIDEQGNFTVPKRFDANDGMISAEEGYMTAVGLDASEYIGAPSVSLWTSDTEGNPRVPGGRCNIPLPPKNGKIDYVDPIGSVVSDASGISMICYQDETFRYQNGTYTP